MKVAGSLVLASLVCGLCVSARAEERFNWSWEKSGDNGQSV